jgi:hypothetical protein
MKDNIWQPDKTAVESDADGLDLGSSRETKGHSSPLNTHCKRELAAFLLKTPFLRLNDRLVTIREYFAQCSA